jgi:hypothetical protein
MLNSNLLCISLSGKNQINENNLKGKSNYNIQSVPLEIKNLKIAIMNKYMIPLFSKQWKTLYENLFFIYKYKNKVNNLYSLYKLEELKVYKDMLQLFEIMVEEHKILDDTERRLYNTTTSKEQFVSMIYKTTKIKLLPEYEVYDSIFGKPKREKGESYKSDLIEKIRVLLSKDDITYSKIKEKILLDAITMP